MSYLDPATGQFVQTSRADRLANLQASVQGIFGTTMDLGPDQPGGQLLGKLIDAIFEADSNLATVHAQRSPAAAPGAQLARIALISGVKKKLPALSTGVVTLTGAPGTIVPSGSLIGNTADSTAVYQTVGDATIGLGGSMSDVNVQSQVAGPVAGAAGTLTVIMTVIKGWTGVTNPAGVSLGNLGETDAALRARRLASVALPSQAMVDGLVAALLQLPNVTQAVVRENPEDTTQTLADGGSLVAHAIEVMVVGGNTTDIANTIWLKKSDGVTMVGGHTEHVAGTSAGVITVGDVGGLHPVNFDIPGEGIFEPPVFVVIHSAPALSSDVQASIRLAIIAWSKGLLQRDGTILQSGQAPTGPSYPALRLGGGVPWAQIFAPINSVQGAVGITAVDIGLTASPTLQADIPGVYNELPSFIDVNITFA